MQSIKRKVKSILCMIASVVFVAGMGMPVFAEHSAAIEKKDVTFTIHECDWTSYSMDYQDARLFEQDGEQNIDWEARMEKYALANVQFKIVKISDNGSVFASDEEGNQYLSTRYTITDRWKELLFSEDPAKMKQRDYTSDELNAALIANKAAVESEIIDTKEGPGVLAEKTDAKGAAKFTIPADEQGIYVVVETEVPENVNTSTDPFLIALPMINAKGSGWNYDVHVYPKNQTDVPTVRKLVKGDKSDTFTDSTSVSSGMKLYYNLIGKIPKVTTQSTELTKFQFVDYLPKGIESPYKIVNGKAEPEDPTQIKVRIYNSQKDAEQNKGDYLELVYGKDYTLEYIYSEYGSSSMVVNLTEEGLKKLNENATGDKFLSVVYPAVVGTVDKLTVGDEGNRSDVSLNYGRSSTTAESEGTVVVEQTIMDAAVVMIYGMEMSKTFDVPLSNEALVEQVQFMIRDVEHDKYLTGEIAAKEGSDTKEYGYYMITGAADSQKDATTFSPNDTGSLVIDGLGEGEFEITETKTVNGYALLKEPVRVSIHAKEIVTTPTTATHAGQEQEVSEVEVADVAGKEKATATVNGEPAQITEEGRVPRVKMTIINKKMSPLETVAASVGIGTNRPKTGDTNPILPSAIAVVAAAGGLILTLYFKKSKRKS